MLQQGLVAPKVDPFAGSTDHGSQFSMWERRADDAVQMRPNLLSDEQNENFLLGHLDGMAREKEGGGIAYGSAKGLFVAGLTPHSVLRKFPTAKCASTKAVDISLRTW